MKGKIIIDYDDSGLTEQHIREEINFLKEDEERELKFDEFEIEGFIDYDFCSGCKKPIEQVDLGNGIIGCPLCKCDDSIEIKMRKIKI